MNEVMRKSHLEASIRLVQEWKASGLSAKEFAELKGMTIGQMKYQIKKIKKLSRENPGISSVEKIEFAPVPKEQLGHSRRMYDAGEITDQPALMFQTGIGCLHVTNQIDPYLLKVAMEVMLSC